MPALRILICSVAAAAALVATPAGPSSSSVGSRSGISSVQMINLFGNNDESKLRRESLSLRDAQAGSRKITFRKPNAATTGLLLGIQFKETFSKAVIVDKILPNTEADKFKKQGKLKEGDEIVMVSATFGSEMWSARGIGKMRLEKSIAVRQGMTIDFVVENSNEKSNKALSKAAQAEKEKMNRLQAQLQAEVDASKKSSNPFKFW